jgi:hypothetical protein
MRTNLKKLAMLGAAMAVLSVVPALAQGRGVGHGVGGGIGGEANAGAGMGNAGANVGGQSGVNGRFGGQSDAGISAQGRANTNGPNAADRDYGRDRAEDRQAARSDTATSANGAARSELGGLNADHASDRARANAAAGSRVGEIGTYQTDMKTAMAITDQTRRNAAITRARQNLARTTNKPLTSDAIAQLDKDLDIEGASSALGASR